MSEERKYYETNTDALLNRKKGDRVYLDPTLGYYLVTPKKIDFWGFDRKPETHFYRYGRMWYTTVKEARENREEGETTYFDKGMELYYNIKPKKSIWNFLK